MSQKTTFPQCFVNKQGRNGVGRRGIQEVGFEVKICALKYFPQIVPVCPQSSSLKRDTHE